MDPMSIRGWFELVAAGGAAGGVVGAVLWALIRGRVFEMVAEAEKRLEGMIEDNREASARELSRVEGLLEHCRTGRRAEVKDELGAIERRERDDITYIRGQLDRISQEFLPQLAGVKAEVGALRDVVRAALTAVNRPDLSRSI